MTGAATAGGEWTDAAAEERGMGIVGVWSKEWIARRSRKTIVFGATIKHCQELANSFLDAGVMAGHQRNYRARAGVAGEGIQQPDSSLRVLISVRARPGF